MRDTSNEQTENDNSKRRLRGGLATRKLGGLLAAAVLLLLAACGQVTTAPPEDVTTEEPEAIAWEWATIGYEDAIEPAATGDQFSLRGSGADIWDGRDEFSFVYTAMSGDGSIVAKVDDLQADHPWAKAGVMLRDGLEPDAPNVFLHISKDNGSVLQMRPRAGATTVNDAGHDTTMPVGGWVRLTRTGATVVGELSRDGDSWSELGRYDTELGEDILVGLAVTAHGRGQVATAEFSRVKRDRPGRPSKPGSGPSTPTNPEPQPEPAPTPPPHTGSYTLPPATLYVATNGSDSNSGRSADSPLRTVSKAATMVRPGDVVYIRGGMYPINVYFRTSGTAAAPIVWASYPGETAVFDGSDQPRGTSQHRMWVDGAAYNHFVNFEVQNSPQAGIFVRNANDNLFHGLVTHGHNGSGVQNYSGNRNVYENLLTYDNMDTVTTNGKIGEDADGIGISAGDSNVIRRVISYNNSDDGIDAWRSTNTLIEYSVSFDNGRGANGNGNGFKLGGANEQNNTVARFNIAFNNKATGFSQNSGRNITLYNNTAYANAGPQYDVGSTVKLRNNVAIGGRNGVISGADSASNSWDLGITDLRLLSTDRNSPDFLALRTGSPAIDAGRDVGLDYQGSAPDLGALEFNETIADLVGSDRLPITEIVRAALDAPVLAQAR